MQSWYKGVDLDKINYYPSALPAKISFTTDDPKREFVGTCRGQAHSAGNRHHL